VEASFGRAIREHLELKRRNSLLDGTMPLDRYREQDAVGSRPPFEPQESTRLQEATRFEEARHESALADVWPDREREPLFGESPEDLWSGSPSFDWGDG
jgi:hypothetical protein